MGGRRLTDEASRARREAIQILGEAKDWQLASTRWVLVSDLLTAFEAALSSGDVEALVAATVELELAGPVRIVRMGSAKPEPASAPLQDRVNELIHSLLRLESQGEGSVGHGTSADG
jgi:hypothetical protein